MKDVYQHFRPEEREFIDRLQDKIDRVSFNYEIVTSDFLNPREYKILESLANASGIKLYSSSDLIDSEMVRVILAPDFYVFDPSDFDLALVEINFPSKFAKISHSQILGTLLGQTGLSRSKIGDILVTGTRAQFFIDSNFLSFVEENISKIGKLGVKLQGIPLSKLMKSDNEDKPSKNKILSVSSLRLDKLVASSFNISRKTASDLIEKGLVKLNYSVEDKKEKLLEIGDLISVRGYGRITLIDELSLSKKDKLRVEVAITKNK
ncbi:YlmH/Sll1252 family protein [Streptococcaceae bacterium ESL0687]|nr:YlmH/Sll1252 family protein [Streptococcaceae bacterium ESL0687]